MGGVPLVSIETNLKTWQLPSKKHTHTSVLPAGCRLAETLPPFALSAEAPKGGRRRERQPRRDGEGGSTAAGGQVQSGRLRASEPWI